MWITYHLLGKIKSYKIETRMLEDHKSSKIDKEINPILLIHLSGPHFRRIMWSKITKIKMRMKSTSLEIESSFAFFTKEEHDNLCHETKEILVEET